jgi:RHH-type transcriptional regulator, rel operon repressor / antitoxin RelB
MQNSTATISLRLPDATRGSLDKAAKITRRSRSFLMKEALERHLSEIMQEHKGAESNSRLSRILALGGAGVRHVGKQSAADINKRIRAFRDDA